MRNVISLGPKLKLIPPPTRRENGISVTIRVKNEIDWIEYCLLSFKDFADEIIIADNGSTDGTIQVIKDFIETHPDCDIRFFDRQRDTYLQLSNFVLQQTKYRYIMRVDADHIAKTSGKYNISKLRKGILNLNPNFYYAISLQHVMLFFDLFHTFGDRLRHEEFWVFTHSPELCCIREGWYTDIIWVPLFYRIIKFSEPFIFHLNIRSKIRMLERRYWGPWRMEGSVVSLSEFILREIKKDFSTDSIEEAAEKYLLERLNYAKKYDATVFDGYPEVLKDLIENPRYKIVYTDDGKIKTRIEPI